MKTFTRSASAKWQGTGLEGKGSLSTLSGAFQDQPYSFKTRFASPDGKAGTNPEELIGAAHAGCFAMALSFGLTGAGFPPEQLDVKATVKAETPDVHWTIVGVHLELTAKAKGLTLEKLREIAEATKSTCPVSKVLNATITLDAKLA